MNDFKWCHFRGEIIGSVAKLPLYALSLLLLVVAKRGCGA